MNPSATSAAPRAAHDALDASPRVPDDLPTNCSFLHIHLPTYNRSSVVEDDVSIFNSKSRSDVSRISFQGRNSTTHPGGGPLWCSGHPATPTNRGSEASSSASSLTSPTWSSSWNFPLRCRAKIVPGCLVRLSPADRKSWGAD